MKKLKTCSGFALLNVLLGVSLLSGIIFLIMHAMTTFHAEDNSRSIGQELSPIMANLLLVENLSTQPNGDGYFLLSNSSLSGCSATTAFLKDVIPKGYIQSVQSSGFNVCNATIGICTKATDTGSEMQCK